MEDFVSWAGPGSDGRSKKNVNPKTSFIDLIWIFGMYMNRFIESEAHWTTAPMPTRYTGREKHGCWFSQSCLLHTGSVDDKYFHASSLVNSIKGVKTHACAHNLPFFCKPTMEESRRPMTDDCAKIKTKQNVFQEAWITSIYSFDSSGKPLLCNGRRFWGRWVFPFGNILRAKLGTETLWTGRRWLWPDNRTLSEPQHEAAVPLNKWKC